MALELRRQVVHALGIFTIFPLLIFGKYITSALIFGFVLLLILLSRIRKNNRHLDRFIKYFERKNESIVGAVTFYIGVFIALIVFPEMDAVAAISVLAVSDSLSTVVGTYYGKHKITENKSFEGSFTFFVSAFLILLIFTDPIRAFLYSLVTTAVEIVPMDDNLTIPVVVGLLLSF